MHSSPLRVRSFAKINLAFSLLGKRSDGFHEVRSIFQSVDLFDELEFRPSTEMRLICQGLPCGPARENLIWRAATALAGAVPAPGGVEIILRKHIPAGAGLGGGSSNAAATLLGLSRFWDLRVPRPELHRLACDLGSDVPYFLVGGTALGVGRGEEIYPLAEFPGAFLVLIFPGVSVSTAEAYRSASSHLTSSGNAHRIQRLCGRLQEGLSCLTDAFNDFETSILPAYPAIREAKASLDRLGARATLLSGSGSSVFGFFLDEESALAASRAAARETWRAFPAKTLSRAEYFHRMFG